MKHTLKSLALLSGLVGAGAAVAGNTDPVILDDTPQVVTQTAPSFGTDWTGGYVGVQLGYGDVDTNGAGLDGDGAIGGIHAGYRWDFGNYVVGAEIDYDITNIGLGGATGELDSVARAKLKAGFDGGQVLYYGTLGAAYADATVGGAGLSDSGYIVGAGVDYQLTNNWVLGGEVLYHDFGSNFDGSGVEIEATTVQARLSYNF